MTEPRQIHLSTTEELAGGAHPVILSSSPVDAERSDVFTALRFYFATRRHWAAIPDTHHYYYTASFGGRIPLRETYDIAPLSCVTDDPDFASVESCGVSDGCARHRTVNVAVRWTIDDGSPFLYRLDRVLAKFSPSARALDDVADCLIFGECARILNTRG